MNYNSTKETFSPEHEYHFESECQRCHKTKTITCKGADLFKYHNGAYVQDAFPYLSAGDRELLFISGICDDCMTEIFSGEDDDDEG